MKTHLVAWNFKDTLSASEKKQYALQLKTELEALPSSISELLELTVTTDLESTSTHEIMLYSTFADLNALDLYQNHPDHLAVVPLIKEVLTDRICLDY
ncbi:MAG: Dabb family protein [Eubacteriales bacterium]